MPPPKNIQPNKAEAILPTLHYVYAAASGSHAIIFIFSLILQ